jgi:predicted hotdog family 3-hydroxylacyl-ACP dehydratase
VPPLSLPPFDLGRSRPGEGTGAGWTIWPVTVPEAGGLFTGHFPGRPILPGISHLAMVQAALGSLGEERPIRALSGVRWKRPGRPGEDMELALSPGEAGGRRRFTLQAGTELLSQGNFGSDGSAEPASPLSIPLDGPLGESVVPAARIPHASPALLIEGVVRRDSESLVCQAVVPAAHPLAQEGMAPAFLSFEAGAQAAALLEALDREGTGAPRIGYLVGIRQGLLDLPEIVAGEPFQVAARLSASAPPLSIYEIEAVTPRGRLASATLSTYLTDEPTG